jgi:hypothetical protein
MVTGLRSTLTRVAPSLQDDMTGTALTRGAQRLVRASDMTLLAT